MTLYLLPFVLWFYPDGSAICRIRRLPHPRFAASAICRGFRRRACIRGLPWLQAARLVMVMVVLKVKRLMFVA